MNKTEMLETARRYVAAHLGCMADDLIKEGTVFISNKTAAAPFLEIATMGKAVIVSASPELLPGAKKLLEGRNRDEIFECPFVYGQSIYYLPDLREIKRLPLPDGYTCGLLQGEEIYSLRGITGFENSLAFDENGQTPTCIVFYAVKDGKIAGLAGASFESEKMWEVGVDVKPAFRQGGLAAALVSSLAMTILEQGVIPFYCASVTNIGSQAVAHRSGFIPAWVSSYRTILDGSSAYGNILQGLKL